MPPSQVDWTPAVVVLTVGVALGLFFIWRALHAGRAAAPAPAVPALELRDLEAKRDALIVQLRELEDTAAKRTGDQLASERYELELEAARAWHALDERQIGAPGGARSKAAPATRPATDTVVAAPPSAWKGFLWGVGSVSAVLLLVVFVSRSAEERRDGGSPTGGGGGVAGGGTEAGDPELERLQAAVAARPDDLAARLDLARLQLMRQDMMGVFEQTQAVLEREPDNPRALSYQALVRMAMGQSDQAESMLKRAIAKDPDLVDGYVHLMLVYLNMGRGRDAETTLATASKKFPDQAASLSSLFSQMRAAASGASETSAPGTSSPADTPGGAAGAVAAPTASGRRVTGVLSLDPSAAARVGAGGVVYVMLRPAGVREGPPLAAIRLPGSGFPLAFAIGDADAMTGEPIPDAVLVEARLDRDGDVATRDAGEPYGSADGIALGTANLQIVLKPRD